jgi:hypothetical protein
MKRRPAVMHKGQSHHGLAALLVFLSPLATAAESKVQLKDLPAAVQKTIQDESKGATATLCSCAPAGRRSASS